MLIEALLKTVFSVIGFIVNPIFDVLYKLIGFPSGAAFPIPAPLFGYVTYYVTNVVTVMPLLIIYWAWRQFKA